MESKNNHLVRHYAFYYLYDTDMTPTPSGRCRSRLWALATCRSTPLDPHQEAQRVGHRQDWQTQTPVRPVTLLVVLGPARDRASLGRHDGLPLSVDGPGGRESPAWAGGR